jgi:hypothetical protein
LVLVKLYLVIVRANRKDPQCDELHFAVAAPDKQAAEAKLRAALQADADLWQDVKPAAAPYRVRATRISGGLCRIPRHCGDL